MKGMNRILVTGGTGMIGRYLVEMLLREGHQVTVAALDGEELCPKGAEYKQLDLRNIDNCLKVSRNIDTIYHLAGVKGSPKMCREKPASFFVPTITFNVNMMEAARRNGVQNFLYTSSVGVYSPAEVFNEDDVWTTFPSENDRFAGWAKRMGELQVDAYKQQYGDTHYSVVRPGNVYGRYDNFDPETAMVIPSLINRIHSGEKPLSVWGDGKAIRDFVHAKDVASAMKFAMENKIEKPINISSGMPTSIKEVVSILSDSFGGIDYTFNNKGVAGDNKRLMNIERLKGYGWEPAISLKDGVKDTVNWYKEVGYNGYNRYNSFKES